MAKRKKILFTLIRLKRIKGIIKTSAPQGYPKRKHQGDFCLQSVK
jgi:hypothetical protein